MREALFFIVILLTNIIQGITGFAGTILAMPPGILLVGYDTARPVLNVLGLLSGIYVFAGNRRSVDRRELGRIVPVMTLGILAGLGIRTLFTGREQALYLALGSFVLLLAAWGLYRQKTCGEVSGEQSGEGRIPGACGEASGEQSGTKESPGGKPRAAEFALLAAAGVVHGIFVSGGPLLVGYLTGRLRDKTVFRATISTVWIVLNSFLLLGDIRAGLWTGSCLRTLAVAVPFLAGGMFAGGRLYRIMSQKTFMTLTYVLLALSGAMLLFKSNTP